MKEHGVHVEQEGSPYGSGHSDSEKLAQLQKLLDSSLDVICSIDAAGRFRYVSAASATLWGYAPEELAGIPYMSLVHPDDHPKTITVAGAITAGVNVTTFENRYVRKDGAVVPVLWSARWNADEALMYCVAKDLTDRRAAEHQEQQRMDAIYNSIQDCFFSADKNFTITFWNRRAEAVLGVRKEDVIGKNLWSLWSEAVPLKFYTEYHRALAENTSVHFDEYLPSQGAWYQVSAYPTIDGLHIYFQDITDRKQQEALLKLANERFTLAAQATSDVLWDWDLVSGTCYFNSSFTRCFGHENAQDVVYRNWMGNIHEDDILGVTESVDNALLDTAVTQWEGEYRFYKSDRAIAHILDRGFIIREENGAAVRMVGSIQDITRLKEASEELERLSLVAKETVNAVVITDPQGRITWVNKAFTDITEFGFAESIGRKPGDLLQGERTCRATVANLRARIAEKVPFNCELVNYSKSGRAYWIEIKGQPIFNEEGGVKQFFAIQTDITRRKEAEALIRSSEEKYKQLFYGSPQPKWTFDAETFRIVEVNEAAVELYGYSRAEFLELTVPDIKEAGTGAKLREVVEELRSGRTPVYHGLLRHVKKNGTIFLIDVTSRLLPMSTGCYIICSGIDMTEKIGLEQEIIAQKIAAQQEVSRAIINTQEKERSEVGKELHDNVCQLLTTAKLYLENIKYLGDRKDEFADRGIRIVQQAINEIRFLSKQLVTPVLHDIGFEATIHELIAHYEALNTFEVQFRYEANEELMDKDLKLAVYRILQELFNNTVKYAGASLVELRILSTDDQVVLQFRDNGCGFDPSAARNGIGLNNIRNRADAYKGVLRIESSSGNGCAVAILFPARL
ncbi:PAS domain S-box protein [Flaviaesturariibacter amylovorans]|uniref:histidine kinase n=1 Tax=Flaviaesturariibacter amylovorans TaxID=1084520 RepID=A0ABP8HP52_9BACT